MKVNVVKYNPNWVKEFERESKLLLHELGQIVNGIHHIGSTAVPDLMAKPIIDMILEVKDLEQLDEQSYRLEKWGYEALGELGIKGRRYFRKGGDDRTHQIHAFKAGDANIMRHLVFRDYLIAHKDIAKQYGNLKFDIAQRCNNDIEQYCDEKDAFVQYHETKALGWHEKIKR